MKFFGLQKLTLLDYPEKTAATVFLSSCDFRCPFCHNAAQLDDDASLIRKSDVIDFLKKRQNILDGVCISGGEPLLHDEIGDFIEEIKNLGFDVKLDTNGQNPALLKRLAENNFIDYVAMDIKSSLQNYGKAVGIENFNTCQIEESADFLLKGAIPYEFRTTVVRELHESNDFHLIGQRWSGATSYFLQSFKDSDGVLSKNLTAYSVTQMNKFCDILRTYNINANLRE